MSRASPPDRISPSQDSDSNNWQQWLLFGVGGLFLLGTIVVIAGPGLPFGGVSDDNTTTTPVDETQQPTSTATPTPTPTPTERVEYRVNAGGQRIEATDDGPDWIADSAGSPARYLNHEAADTIVSNTSDSITVENPVSESVPREMFKSYRFERGGGLFSQPDEMTWAFPVDPEHEYEVRIYVMEPFFVDRNPDRPDERLYSEGGPRTFDISIEDEIVVEGYEPFVEHGHDVGAVKAFETSPDDGTLTIQFHRGAENPTISGIEIVDKGPRDANNGRNESEPSRTVDTV